MNKEKFIQEFETRSSKPLSGDDKKFLEGIFDGVRGMIGDNLTADQIKEQIDMQVREAASKIDLPEEAKEQLRSALASIEKFNSTNVRKAIEERFNLRKKLEENKQAILGAVKEKREISFDFQVRAASMMTTTNTAISSGLSGINSFSDNYDIDPNIALIRYPKNFVLNIITSRQVEKVPESRLVKQQKSKEGNAEITLEGGLKKLMSYTFEDKVYKKQKAAAHMEFTEEFEMDFEALYNAILDLFERDVLEDYQDKLLTQVLSFAAPYASTGLDGKIVDPDMYAVVGAGTLAISQLGFQPDIVWMNPNDRMLMRLSQTSDGGYKLPPFAVNDNRIDGLTVYESTKIDQGKILIGDSRTIREEHTGFKLRFGFINEQFIHNERSCVGEVFSMMFQRDTDAGSWIYYDIATIQAALLKP